MESVGIVGEKTREVIELAAFDEAEIVTVEGPLAEGETKTFQFADPSGLRGDGLVIRHKGQLHAFKNVCRHQPLPLDYGDGDFLTEEKDYLLCRNHGALFEPDTGLCVSGPCVGASLFQFPVKECDGNIIITIPHEEIDLE